jgi:TrmH family RNA methyltransferase
MRTLGRHHRIVRRVRALRTRPELRREESALVAEGIHLAREALASGAEIELALVSPRLVTLTEGAALLRALDERGVSCAELDDALLASLQDARTPQPVLLVVRRPRPSAEEAIGAVPIPLVAVAAGVQDPGNLGGLVRTADAAGATACWVCEGCADPYHPRAVRATMGSIFRLPLALSAPADALLRLRARGLRLIGADPVRGADYDRSNLAGPTALVFGGEGAGLAAEWRAALDDYVRVPMRCGVESLSVGAAAAVVLFEAARQRRAAQSSAR